MNAVGLGEATPPSGQLIVPELVAALRREREAPKLPFWLLPAGALVVLGGLGYWGTKRGWFG